MKYLDKFDSDQFEKDLLNNYQKVTTQPNEFKYKLSQVFQYLIKAANCLDEAKLEKEATEITNLITKLAQATDENVNLTPEEMEENLKEYGWVFNEPKDEIET